jgi:3-mercaptopyruvate sulfurtransferase SseA
VDGAAVAAATAAAASGVGGEYPAKLQEDLVKSMEDVRAAIAAGVQIVDARAAGRFKGLAPEPRADVPSGAMPGPQLSVNRAAAL